ncbi:type II toxin-antitoxin system VapC family toxin [Candidatus Poribacteria bacterium]
MSEKPAYILDSFAVIAYLSDEEGADRVEELLDRASEGEINLFMHAINLGEVLYTVFREEGEIQAMNVYSAVRRYPVEFVDDLSESFLLNVISLKGTYPISYADAFAAATAIEMNGILVTGDPELKRLEMDKRFEILWV